MTIRIQENNEFDAAPDGVFDPSVTGRAVPDAPKPEKPTQANNAPPAAPSVNASDLGALTRLQNLAASHEYASEALNILGKAVSHMSMGGMNVDSNSDGDNDVRTVQGAINDIVNSVQATMDEMAPKDAEAQEWYNLWNAQQVTAIDALTGGETAPVGDLGGAVDDAVGELAPELAEPAPEPAPEPPAVPPAPAPETDRLPPAPAQAPTQPVQRAPVPANAMQPESLARRLEAVFEDGVTKHQGDPGKTSKEKTEVIQREKVGDHPSHWYTKGAKGNGYGSNGGFDNK